MSEKLRCFGCTETPLLVTTFLSASGERWAVYECVNPDCFFFAIPKHDLLDNIDIQYVRVKNPQPKGDGE